MPVFLQDRFILNENEDVPVFLVSEEWILFMRERGRSPGEISHEDFIAFVAKRFVRGTPGVYPVFEGLQLRNNNDERVRPFRGKKYIGKLSYPQLQRSSHLRLIVTYPIDSTIPPLYEIPEE